MNMPSPMDYVMRSEGALGAILISTIEKDMYSSPNL